MTSINRSEIIFLFGVHGQRNGKCSKNLQLVNFLVRKISMGDSFKALASEPRRRILNHLAGGPMTVGEIADKFDMAMPSISKHLSVLKEAGLVREQKRGQFVLYHIVADNLANTLYSFLTPFCPDARRISTERREKNDDD
ncbi:MAG: winged helix-turn-helix transcriptional regulator [Alphaproteobacteria bacterium]|nr:winged helix-turn-helix transcriptional regulator [Alphaproteobacteria bacterium]